MSYAADAQPEVEVRSDFTSEPGERAYVLLDNNYTSRTREMTSAQARALAESLLLAADEADAENAEERELYA